MSRQEEKLRLLDRCLGESLALYKVSAGYHDAAILEVCGKAPDFEYISKAMNMADKVATSVIRIDEGLGINYGTYNFYYSTSRDNVFTIFYVRGVYVKALTSRRGKGLQVLR